MLGILEEIMRFDDHRDSDKPNSISVTTLIGPMYKAKLYLAKTPKYDVTDITFQRSSFIGTAFHSRAEMITKDNPDYITEEFLEKEVVEDGITYTVAGTFDGIKKVDGKWYIYDYKTGFGKDRNEAALAKDAMQMSIYRWLLKDKYPDITVEDTAYSIFVSQSANVMKEIPVQLMCTNWVEDYAHTKLWSIVNNEKVDCQEGIKYNGCTYCSYNCTHRKK